MKCQSFKKYIIIVYGKQHRQSAKKKKEAVIDLYYNQGKDNTWNSKDRKDVNSRIPTILLLNNITRQDFKAVNIKLIRYAIHVRFRKSEFA